MLARARKRYDGLDARGRDLFDTDSLWNPYADSRVLYDDGREIGSVIWGIDITPAEAMLADRLRRGGTASTRS